MPRVFYEANQASSTCRLELESSVETSTPPFFWEEGMIAPVFGGGKGEVGWRNGLVDYSMEGWMGACSG